MHGVLYEKIIAMKETYAHLVSHTNLSLSSSYTLDCYSAHELNGLIIFEQCWMIYIVLHLLPFHNAIFKAMYVEIRLSWRIFIVCYRENVMLVQRI